jgi:phosphoserine phosphatase RsbU/P
MPVARTSSHQRNLKLYTEQPPKNIRPPIEAIGSLPEVLRAFQHATGWSLRYVAGAEPRPSADLSSSAPVNPGAGAALGHLMLGPLDSAPGATAGAVPSATAVSAVPGGATAVPAVAGSANDSHPADPASARRLPVARRQPMHLESARVLASALAGMLGELMQTRQALWEREAELAAGVPLVPHPEEEKHLAVRLEAVLRGGAQAVGCQAAALYLLDDATSKLKLRSCWGLPWDRLTAPARALQGAVADLEAMLGHAVVLDDADLLRHWNVPEDFAAGVCVPVATPTTILGTFWVFCDEKRTFDDRQTNVLEVVAGRIAAELEREILLREGFEAAELKKQLAAAERLQRSQLPSISPLLDNWDVAGWTAQAGPVGGDFHDWFCLPDGLVAVAVGHAMGRGIEAAMAAGALKAALRAHAPYHREAQQTLKRLNLTLWTGSAGDQRASLLLGLIETATGRVCCASAGQPGIVRLRQDAWESFSEVSPKLGESPEPDYEQFGCELGPGEVLVLFTDGVRDGTGREGRLQSEAGVAEALSGRLDLSADDLASLVRKQLDTRAPNGLRCDRTVLVVKRRGG